MVKDIVLCGYIIVCCISCAPNSGVPANNEKVDAAGSFPPAIAVPPEPPEPVVPPPTIQNTPPTSIVEACNIKSAIKWMNSQVIDYAQVPGDEWRDCSGNFLRLSSRLASICPGAKLVAAPGIKKYKPHGINKTTFSSARTTREIAKWYHDNGAFIPIFYDSEEASEIPDSLRAIRNQIEAGVVLWFSRGIPRSNDGLEGLFVKSSGAGKIHINHMATVYKVFLDSNGDIDGWEMYHGQNERKNNGITRHSWSSAGKPPGHYGGQRIVGFSKSIIVPESIAAAAGG